MAARTRRLAALLALLAACAGFLLRRRTAPRSMTGQTLVVAFPYASSASFYDPMRIHLAHEYVFLANIYSPLIEHAADGQLVSSAAERFEWAGNEARFTFREGLRTIDGRGIDAYDAEIMFKRALILGGNTHGDLAAMICPGRTLKSIDDACPEMEVRDAGRVLAIRFAKPTPFFFPMLTAIDFAVIPRASLDPKTLAIKDYRNTSGPYYVVKDDPAGNIELAANPGHFHYSADMPQRVRLRPVTLDAKKSALELMSEGQVDMVTEVDAAPQEDKIAYATSHADVALHATFPICFYGVVFTQKGMRRLDRARRLAVGTTLKRIFLEQHAGRPGFEPAEQIFPVSGEGALTPEELKEVSAEWAASASEAPDETPLSVWTIVKNFDTEDPALKKAFPRATYKYIRKIPGLVDYKKEGLEEPDVFISRTDMSFLEDIGLLSYHSHTDFFSLRGKAAEDWLLRYMSIADKLDRLPMLRELHFRTLRDAAVVPIAFSPYAAVVRKPWTSGMSRIHAGDTLWRLKSR